MKNVIVWFKKKIVLSAFVISFISVFSGIILFPNIFKQYSNQTNRKLLGITTVVFLLISILLSICTSILCIFLKNYKESKIQVTNLLHSLKRLMCFFVLCIVIILLMSIFYGLFSQVVYSLAYRELHIDIIKNIISIITNVITLCLMPLSIFLFFSYMVEEKKIKESLFQIVKGDFQKYFKTLMLCALLFLFGHITGLGIQKIEIQALAVSLHMLILVILGTISIPMFAAMCIKIKREVS